LIRLLEKRKRSAQMEVHKGIISVGLKALRPPDFGSTAALARIRQYPRPRGSYKFRCSLKPCEPKHCLAPRTELWLRLLRPQRIAQTCHPWQKSFRQDTPSPPTLRHFLDQAPRPVRRSCVLAPGGRGLAPC